MKPDLSLLKQVLQLPTAPFHEEKVSDFVLNFCKRLGVSVQKDSFGNLKAIYKRGKTAPIAFTSHMDHPGFEVVRGGNSAQVQLLGGVPDKYFLKAKVLVFDQGRFVKAKVTKLLSKKKRIFSIQTKKPVFKGGFGYFDLPACKFQNGLIYTKAADNVMSVACLLNLLQELVRKKARAQVLCIFTRAEEVGFVGALGLIKNGFLSKKIPTVVLETSSAKAGRVVIGGGPVLRTGDRFSSFSWELDLWLRIAAEELKKKDKHFKYQRALLTGGRCEASVYVAAGYPVGGLAFPLGNYHNVGLKNYASEYIHQKDFEKMLKWLFVLATRPPSNGFFKKARMSVEKVFEKYSSRLKNVS